MKEIEVKFLHVDPLEIKRRLKLLGARRVFGPTLIKDFHFRHPDLAKKYFTLFRLRQEGKKTILTIKKGRAGGKFKIEEEQELHIIEEQKDVQDFLHGMGFGLARQLEKFREEYEIDGLKVEIDRYPKMKPYIEIEGPSQKAIRTLAEKLGLDFQDATNETATELIEKAGLNPRKLFFKKSA